MADPLTVLGALAATAQLAEQMIKVSGLIHELYTNIQQAAKIIGSRMLAVNRLISISRLIMTNAALQTDAIASVLATCLETAQKIKSLLEKIKGNRLKQAVLVMAKEKEVIGLFEELEKAKSSLMLCMQEVDSRILDTLQSDIKAMKDEMFGKSERAAERRPNVDGQYYEVPKRKVRSFVGQKDILDQIKSLYFVPEPSTHLVVLRAMGGQGKTQIALEICRQMKEICSAIFWVDASSENSLKKDFEQIYERIKKTGAALADTHSKSVYVQKSFCEWPHPWLMVFDNYDDPQVFSNIQEFIPESSFGRILITSRHADTLALADEKGRIELRGLAQKDAVELLLRQSALQGVQHDDHAASAIVERLGCHPLAIDQAGSYIHKRRISLEEFLIDYESRQKTILQEIPRMTQYRRKVLDADQEILLNVFTTCELSFQQLLAKDDSRRISGRLLTFIAFFHCSSFYESVIRGFWNNPLRVAWSPEASHFLSECLGLSDGKWDSGIFLDRLVELRDLSLIQSFNRDPHGYSYLTLHPLIQDWLILRLDHETCVQYSVWATNVLLYSAGAINFYSNSTIVQYITRNNMNCKRFLQPAVIKGDGVYEWAFANAVFSDILVDAKLYIDAARTVEGAICAIDQRDRDDTIAQVLKLKRHLARCWQLQCRWEDATNLYREISWEMGTIDPRATYTTEELASCPMDAKEKSAAQMLCRYEERTTLENGDSLNKMYHYDVLNGLCWTLGCHGMSLEADLIMSEALKQMEIMVTPGSLQETNLPMEDAAEEMQRKLLGQRIMTGSETEATAQVDAILDGPVPLGFFDLLGRTITHQCRAPKATAKLIEVVRRHLQALSARQESGIMAASQLLGILLGIKNLERAKRLVIPPVIWQRILRGAGRPEALEILLLLADALTRIGKSHDAGQLAERVLAGCMVRYGAKHPQTLHSQFRVALLVPLPEDND